MEYLNKNVVLNEQGINVHAKCAQRYAELQASYEHKNVEMKNAVKALGVRAATRRMKNYPVMQNLILWKLM